MRQEPSFYPTTPQLYVVAICRSWCYRQATINNYVMPGSPYRSQPNVGAWVSERTYGAITTGIQLSGQVFGLASPAEVLARRRLSNAASQMQLVHLLVQLSGGMLIYYLLRSDPKDPEYDNGLLAFPKGFRMLAGDPRLRSFNNGSLEQRAISYVCLGNSGPQTNGFPNRNCPDGLRVQVVFPSCWDGRNVDSPDHKSHMAYPSGVSTGRCPVSHPKRFVTLFYEVIFSVKDFKDRWYGQGQPFVLSNGDPTGFGLHGDFLNGWDISVLQQAVTQCTDSSGNLEKCKVFQFFDDEMRNGCRVPVKVNEPVTGQLNTLPGCNSVQDGPQNAQPQADCGATTQISEPQWGFKDNSPEPEEVWRLHDGRLLCQALR
ncbi:hypothetical protein Cob_v005236 [Colletotrichum orbiculare MAFF 240422]|uniref:DUF1996 domain-containing protein n=1 Tax=Colletotrichum orbiculare (strain 104-T / ATCC 96160 / CBS 514.97 / LARS 414 / MAFF 240422) TaxID=1213857 RepID=A0A484FV07_COLOR|nr:hypothetical protein Cob_v005236 [Colletotrichum orbiculare MAFF 240422]